MSRRLTVAMTLALAGFASPMHAQDEGLGFARVFASREGRYGFRLLVQPLARFSPVGTLFTLDRGGGERVVWERPLRHTPARVLVSDRGHVVRLGRCDLGPEVDALVIFDRGGYVLRSFGLPDLDPTLASPAALAAADTATSWLAEVWFCLERPESAGLCAHLLVRLSSGALLTIDLESGEVVSSPHRPGAPWPEHLAGRAVATVCPQYALYGTSAANVEGLRTWLNAELRAFRARFGALPGPGLILAIEPGEEPFAPLERWRAEHVDRARSIDWTDSSGRESFRSTKGRPYCYGPTQVYFRESFALAPAEAAAIGLLGETRSTAAWVCALTTDTHVLAAFDEQYRRWRSAARQEMERRAGQLSPNYRLGDWMMYLVGEWGLGVYRRIDRDLMRLQRREVLWESLLQRLPLDEAARSAEVARLREEIDGRWKQLYFSRPTD